MGYLLWVAASILPPEEKRGTRFTLPKENWTPAKIESPPASISAGFFFVAVQNRTLEKFPPFSDCHRGNPSLVSASRDF